jgi:hypothetical protein
MRTNVAVESVNDIMDYITQSEVGNRHHHKNTCMFICLVIGIGLLSLLLVPTSAQASSSSPTSGAIISISSSAGSGTDKQMGICVVGVESPCNGRQ